MGMIDMYKPKSTIMLEGDDTIDGEVGSTVDVSVKAKIVSTEEVDRDGKKHKHQRLEIVSGDEDKDDEGDSDNKKKMMAIVLQAKGKGVKDA